MIGLIDLYSLFIQEILPAVGFVVFYLLPALLVFLAYKTWMMYITGLYIKDMEWTLLEIKMPEEISKSPKAMEVVLSALHQGVDGNWYKRLTTGFVRPWFSLELVSLSGEVHFFIRTPSDFKNLIESQIYSQYPDVEIFEAKEDYTNYVSFGKPESRFDIWGTQFALTKEDAYPIKTYIDYGLDSDPKEEFKVDPMTPILEFLGSIKKGDQIWIQILIQATKKRFKKEGSFLGLGKTDWKQEGDKLIEKIKKQATDSEGRINLTDGQKKTAEAIERNIAKLGFDTGIRSIYIAPKDDFDKTNNGALIGILKQFSSENLNGLKPDMATTFNYPWQDVRGKRLMMKKMAIFDAYRRRSYFYGPYKYKPMILNTEELATIYHFPGQVASTPSLDRIGSRRGEAPPNLPI